MNTTISSTSPRRLGGLLLKALAAGALVFSLAGCIPIPILEITPAAPETGESVTFDGTGTIVSNIPEDTVAVSYRWTFGDGEKGSGLPVIGSMIANDSLPVRFVCHHGGRCVGSRLHQR